MDIKLLEKDVPVHTRFSLGFSMGQHDVARCFQAVSNILTKNGRLIVIVVSALLMLFCWSANVGYGDVLLASITTLFFFALSMTLGVRAAYISVLTFLTLAGIRLLYAAWSQREAEPRWYPDGCHVTIGGQASSYPTSEACWNAQVEHIRDMNYHRFHMSFSLSLCAIILHILYYFIARHDIESL